MYYRRQLVDNIKRLGAYLPRTGIYRITQILRSISCILVYLPVLWIDRDWDHHFLFELLRVKLRRMEKYFIEQGVADDNRNVAQQINYTLKLLDRIESDGDVTWRKLDKYIDATYGESKFEPRNRKSGKYKGLTSWWVRAKVDSRAKLRRSRELEMELYTKQRAELERDREKLANVIRYHIYKWWD